MLLFTKIRMVAVLAGVVELTGGAALARDPVPGEHPLSSNCNTDASGSDPRTADPSSAQSTPCSQARASAAAAPTPYPFRIQSPDATRRIEIRSMYDVAVARCIGGCVLSLPESSYRLVFRDAEGNEQGLPFSVKGKGGVELQDADETAASVGLGLGVAGPVFVVTGMALMTIALKDACLAEACESQHDSSGGAMLLGGLVAMAVGAVITPIGWVTYARNRHPRVRELYASFGIAAAPSRDGGFLGLTGRF